MSKKIAVFIGSRANWGRLRSVCKAIEDCPDLELQVILGASGLWEDITYPCERIECLLQNDTTEAMVLTTSLLLTQIAGVLQRTQPSYVLVHGDRYEVLAVAMAAAYMNIPLAHTEGGEYTGTIDDKVRYAITALADVHFPTFQQAYNRLNSIVDNVFLVGSPALDRLNEIDLTSDREPYVLVLQHPNTTHPESLEPLIEAIKELPFHKVWINPNVDAGNKAMLKLIHKQDAEFLKDLSTDEFYKLLNNAKCCIGNSSSFITEGAYLGIPSVLVGSRELERGHGANAISVKNDKQSILDGIHSQLSHGRYEPDYRFGNGHASQKIVEVLCTL